MKVITLVLLAVALLLGGGSAESVQAQEAPFVAPGQFTTRCEFDITRMRQQKDPIVQPGVFPSAHMHDYYGFIRPTEFTQANDILTAGSPSNPGYWIDGKQPSSTCRPYGNWPNYWFPTPMWSDGLFTPRAADPGKRTVASSWLLNTYRRTGDGTEPLIAPPYGMAVVVGNAKANSLNEQDTTHIRWSCGELAPSFRRPVDCTGVGEVTALAIFPNCWNGQHGWGNANSRTDDANETTSLGWDSTVDQPVDFDTIPGIGPSNFAYAEGNDPCPASHPHRIAQLVTRQHFTDPRTGGPLIDPFDEAGNILLSFASGPYYSYHADYFALWSKSITSLVAKCINGDLNFANSDTVDCDDGRK